MPKRILPLLSLLAATHSSWATGEFYCCKDPASGRRICADSIPAQCRSQGYQIYDKAGNALRDVPPPLTLEQKKAAADAAERQRVIAEALREQRRVDQALLDTYANVGDIDLTQRKAEDDVNFSIQAASAKLNAALERQRKLANEAEFYKHKPMPVELSKDVRSVGHEIQLQQELIDLKKKELAQIRAKYDADRKRYFELTGQRSLR